jgi:hypothetical protein
MHHHASTVTCAYGEVPRMDRFVMNRFLWCSKVKVLHRFLEAISGAALAQRINEARKRNPTNSTTAPTPTSI